MPENNELPNEENQENGENMRSEIPPEKLARALKLIDLDLILKAIDEVNRQVTPIYNQWTDVVETTVIAVREQLPQILETLAEKRKKEGIEIKIPLNEIEKSELTVPIITMAMGISYGLFVAREVIDRIIITRLNENFNSPPNSQEKPTNPEKPKNPKHHWD